jgi:hypothetical protein
MLKAVKILSHNKKKHCNIGVDIIREECVFNAFMPVFWVLLLEIFEGVIFCVTNVMVRERGASRKEFDCEVVDGLADWDKTYLQFLKALLSSTLVITLKLVCTRVWV